MVTPTSNSKFIINDNDINKDLHQIKHCSLPKRVNTTMSNYVAKFYQNRMDERLSAPKRAVQKFGESPEAKISRAKSSDGFRINRNLLEKIKQKQTDSVTI
jgi:hypothetical protein